MGDDFLKLRPDQDFIVDGNSDDYDTHIQSSTARDGSYGLVYSWDDDAYSIDLSRFSGKSLKAIWYNPRKNHYQAGPDILFSGDATLLKVDPPGDKGPAHDWVLMVGEKNILDNLVVK